MNIKKITYLHASGPAKNKYFLFLAENEKIRYCLFFIPFFLSTVFYFLATKNGNLSTFDSFWYKEIATNLATDFSYSREGEFVMAWPPLYPVILALAHGSMDNFIHVFHWACLLASLFIWMKIGRFYLSDHWLTVYIISLSVATPVMMLAVFVWSEIFFLLLFSAYTLYCLKFIRSRGRRDILVAALFGFLMMLQRNAGIFLFAGSLAGFAVNYKVIDRRNIAPFSTHVLIAVAGFTVWNIYALLFKSKIQIMSELVPEFSPIRNVLLSFREIGLNFVPGLFSYGASLAGFLTFVGSGIYLAADRKKGISLLYLYMILFVYLLTWFVIPASEHDISRFMAVVLPVLYLFTIVMLRFLSWRYPGFQMLMAITVLVWIFYSVVRLSRNVLLWADYGI